MPTTQKFPSLRRALALFVIFTIVVPSLPLTAEASKVRLKGVVTNDDRALCQAWLSKTGSGASPKDLTFNAVSWTCRQCNVIDTGISARWPNQEVACSSCDSGMVPTAAAEAYDQSYSGGFTARRRGANNSTARSTARSASRRATYPSVATPAPAPARASVPYFDLAAPVGAPAITDAPAPRGTVGQRTISRLSEMFLFGRNRLLHRIALGVGIVGLSIMSATTGISMADRPIMGTVETATWTQTVRLERDEPGIFPMSFDSLAAENGGAIPEVLPATEGNPEAHLVETCAGAGSTCFYESNRWHTEDSEVRHGDVTTPIPANGDWAGFDVPADGRVTTETTFETVLTFVRDGETFHVVWTPDSPQEFTSLTPGRHIEVELSPLRHVTGVEITP